MNQKKLDETIRKHLVTLLAEQNITLPVMVFQPTKQGRITDGIYFFPLDIGKRGWQQRKYVPGAAGLIAEETQINESLYQFQACVNDDVSDPEQLLVNDILSLVRSVIQSLKFIRLIAKEGIGVQRATQIVSSSFVNENDQFEKNPNFTVVFTHSRTLGLDTPAIKHFTFNHKHI